MTARELTEWQAFYLYVEPFGGKFLDMQFASLRMANYAGKEKKSLDDFMLYDYSLLSPEQKEQEKRNVARAKARNQVTELRDFFASKVNAQKTANKP